MRTIVIPDIHGRSSWKIPAYNEKWDRFIFIGDYFDSYDLTTVEQIHNFKEIIQFKEQYPDKVFLLIGNHDEHYFPFMGYTGTSGYQSGAAPSIGHLLMTYIDLLQVAYGFDDFLCTHAGVGETWINNTTEDAQVDPLLEYEASAIADWINDLWKYKSQYFQFTGCENTGDSIGQTPLWIRPLSLTKDSHEIRKSVIQIVGHTQQSKLYTDEISTLGGRYYFIDTLGTSGEYLIIENKKITTGKI